MKHLLLPIALFLLQNHLPAQSMLEDAVAMRDFFDTTDAADIDQRLILNWDNFNLAESDRLISYCKSGEQLSTFWVEESFRGNPFLLVDRTDQNEVLINDMALAGVTRAPQKSASGFSVTNLADGLARFLVKRTKQELSQAFFDDFKKRVKKDPYLKHFCPFTRAQMLRIDTDVYQFNDYLESLREGFTADMTALPGSMESFIRDESLCKDCLKKTEGKIVTDLLHVAQQMVNGEPPIDMISYLAHSESIIQGSTKQEPVMYNMASALRFLDIVSESFRNSSAPEGAKMPWYTSNEIRQKLNDPIVLRIYLGLLWQKVGGIAFVDDSGTQETPMRTFMGQGSAGAQLISSWRNSVQSLGELTHSMQYGIQSSSGTNNTVADDFFSYSQSVTDLLMAVNQTGRVMFNRGANDLIPTDYILLMRQCNSLYFNVRQRNFGGAVSNVIYCLNILQGRDPEAKKKIAEMLRYANFMASIAEANTAEEMERAIELFALPPGSSRMKKQPGRFSVALNAFTGFAAGQEYLGGDSKGKKVRALTAPLGLSCSVGLGKAGSIGAFIPVLDVGAVTAYRFDDDNADNLPELTWNNILSPGFYFVYDFPKKWPIAFGWGAQVGPSLRKVTENGITVEKNGWRQGVFLAVDIPITYFYLSRRKN